MPSSSTSQRPLAPHVIRSVEGPEWRRLRKRVRIYGWMTLAAAALASVVLAHPRLFSSILFTTCGNAACTWAFHFLEVPFVACITFVALQALLKFSLATRRRLLVLIGFANMVELAFFSIESMLVITSIQRGAPTSEMLVYAFAALLLLVGASLGLWAQLGVNDHLHPPLDPRFEHPRTEGELVLLVKKARLLGVQLRVRGSEHCRPRQAIHTDPGGEHLDVQLDRYNQILEWDDAHRRVTVQAGCHLGVDPNDPLSTKKNSLLWQLEQRGWALPDLGGITHQTVAGFLSTGSMGGTLHHDLGGAIVGIRIIDGTGEVHELKPDSADPDDEKNNPFYAVGVSMGLLGVISTVTFQCEPRYDVEGRQLTSATAKCAIDLFDPGEKGLVRYWEKNAGGDTYGRLLWWPQKGVDKVELWTAHRGEDAGAQPRSHHERFKRRPFVSVPRVLQWLIINPFYNLLAEDGLPYAHPTEKLVRRVLNLFLRDGEETFRDTWLRALPMDDQISDRHVPTEFTELFIDIGQADEVMRLLRDYFNPGRGDVEALRDAAGMNRTGAYAFELYPGLRSRFWMSPSHGRPSLRLDVFWFRTGADQRTREAFFERFWNLLREKHIDFRPHWGKYLPPPDSQAGADYLRTQYPMWDEFLRLRRLMDPHGIFLSTYWKEHLGIEAPVARPVPPAGTPEGTARARASSGLIASTRRRVRRGRLYLSIAVLELIFWLRSDMAPSSE